MRAIRRWRCSAEFFVLYLTEAIPLAIASLLVVPAAVLSGITNVRGALDGFAASPVYLIVGAFILATAMVKTRLAERITYLILARIGTSPDAHHARRNTRQHRTGISRAVVDRADRHPAAGMSQHSCYLRVRRPVAVRDQPAADADDDQRDDRRRRADGHGSQSGHGGVHRQNQRPYHHLRRVAALWVSARARP